MHEYRFAHHKLDAWHVALEALRLSYLLAGSLPRGNGELADQLRRAALGAYLQLSEAAARSGGDRVNRFRCARGEASEAASAVEAAMSLQLVDPKAAHEILALFDRLCAMLTRLGKFGPQAN